MVYIKFSICIVQASLAMIAIALILKGETVQGANGGPIVLMSAGMPFRSTHRLSSNSPDWIAKRIK